MRLLRRLVGALISQESVFGRGTIREQKRHIKLLHIKLFPVAPVTGAPGQASGQKIYVPWVPRIVHKTLTPRLLVGRPPGHRRGHRQKNIYVCVPFLS